MSATYDTRTRFNRIESAKLQIAGLDAELRAEALRRFEDRPTWRDWLAVPGLMLRAAWGMRGRRG